MLAVEHELKLRRWFRDFSIVSCFPDLLVEGLFRLLIQYLLLLSSSDDLLNDFHLLVTAIFDDQLL